MKTEISTDYMAVCLSIGATLSTAWHGSFYISAAMIACFWMPILMAKVVNALSGTGTRPDDEIVKLLKSIDARLGHIEATSKKIDRCMDDDNHQHQMCVRTGHWNG